MPNASPTMPSRLLVHHAYPAATTGIVIGDLTQVPPELLAPHRHLLWWTDAASAPPPADPRLQLAHLGATPLQPTLDRFLQRDPRRLPSLYVTESILTRQTSAFEQLAAAVHAVLEAAHRDRVTRQKDGFTWQNHLLTNAPAYLAQRLPAAWAGQLAGLPAFIVASGPSLEVSAPHLARVASHGVVFSADSALRALARHGVTAHFAVSIDAAKVPEKCLPAPDFAPHHVVLASVSPPAWTATLPAPQVHFLSSNQITESWFTTQGITPTAVRVTENCGSTALELACHLGCDPIYLFGLDLAVDARNQAIRHHQDADKTIYTQSNYDPTATLPTVPGNYSETVPTFALGDWRELDARLAARTDRRILNINDRGARFRGTELIHPDHFVFTPPPAPPTPPLAALARVPAAAATDAVLRRLRESAAFGAAALPELHAALHHGGPSALAVTMRRIVLTGDFSRYLGAFALKLMPHLVPPIEGDPAFWQTLLEEFTELVQPRFEA